MIRPIPQSVHQAIAQAVEQALRADGSVNVPVLAEQVRRRNEIYNVALEDIASEILMRAQMHSAVIVFDAAAS
jgi:hypothetical protein